MIQFSLFKMDKHKEQRKADLEAFMEKLKRENPKEYRKMMIARRLHKKPEKATQ